MWPGLLGESSPTLNHLVSLAELLSGSLLQPNKVSTIHGNVAVRVLLLRIAVRCCVGSVTVALEVPGAKNCGEHIAFVLYATMSACKTA